MMKFTNNILWFLSILLLHCSISSAGQLKAIDFSTSTDPYAFINNVTILQLEKKGCTVKVFEIGGGDPAMNGNKLIINIKDWDSEGNSYTWDSGIDIYRLKEVIHENHKIILLCTEHVPDNHSGEIKTLESRYSVSFFFNQRDYIKEVIEVNKLN